MDNMSDVIQNNIKVFCSELYGGDYLKLSMAGLSVPDIINIASGKKHPSQETVGRMSHMFGLRESAMYHDYVNLTKSVLTVRQRRSALDEMCLLYLNEVLYQLGWIVPQKKLNLDISNYPINQFGAFVKKTENNNSYVYVTRLPRNVAGVAGCLIKKTGKIFIANTLYPVNHTIIALKRLWGKGGMMKNLPDDIDAVMSKEPAIFCKDEFASPCVSAVASYISSELKIKLDLEEFLNGKSISAVVRRHRSAKGYCGK